RTRRTFSAATPPACSACPGRSSSARPEGFTLAPPGTGARGSSFAVHLSSPQLYAPPPPLTFSTLPLLVIARPIQQPFLDRLLTLHPEGCTPPFTARQLPRAKIKQCTKKCLTW